MAINLSIRLNNCSASTFIELLIALSLALVLSGGLCSLTSMCVNFYQSSQRSMRQLCGTELALDALRRDCLSAYYEQPWIGCGVLVIHRMNPQGVCQPAHVRWTVEPEGVRRTQGLFDPQSQTWSNATHYHISCLLKALSIEPIYHQRGHVCALAIKYQRAPDTDQQQSTVVLANRIEYYD